MRTEKVKQLFRQVKKQCQISEVRMRYRSAIDAGMLKSLEECKRKKKIKHCCQCRQEPCFFRKYEDKLP